jgi:hypothetical protein
VCGGGAQEGQTRAGRGHVAGPPHHITASLGICSPYASLVVCHMLDTWPDAFCTRVLLGHTVWLTFVANTRQDSSRHIWIGTGVDCPPRALSPPLLRKNPARVGGAERDEGTSSNRWGHLGERGLWDSA